MGLPRLELSMFIDRRGQEDRRVSPDRRATDRRAMPSAQSASILQRFSWSGVGFGTLLALALQVCMFVLGMAIGIYNPVHDNLVQRIGQWQIVMTVVSFLPAGYLAARIGSIPSKMDGVLHGVFVWALAILLAPSLGGRIGVASAFAIPADLPSALWAISALGAGLLAALLSAFLGTPRPRARPTPPPESELHVHN